MFRAASCGGSASTSSRPWSRPNRCAATSASIPARSSTSTSKKLGRFEQVGHRITGDRKGQNNSRGLAGNICIWRSTTAPAWLTRKSCPTKNVAPALRFLFNALCFFRAHGVQVQHVMTDNGVSFRSHRYTKALRLLKIKHLRTNTPKTNGKAERFVQTSLREWACAPAYLTSDRRAQH